MAPQSQLANITKPVIVVSSVQNTLPFRPMAEHTISSQHLQVSRTDVVDSNNIAYSSHEQLDKNELGSRRGRLLPMFQQACSLFSRATLSVVSESREDNISRVEDVTGESSGDNSSAASMDWDSGYECVSADSDVANEIHGPFRAELPDSSISHSFPEATMTEADNEETRARENTSNSTNRRSPYVSAVPGGHPGLYRSDGTDQYIFSSEPLSDTDPLLFGSPEADPDAFSPPTLQSYAPLSAVPGSSSLPPAQPLRMTDLFACSARCSICDNIAANRRNRPAEEGQESRDQFQRLAALMRNLVDVEVRSMSETLHDVVYRHDCLVGEVSELRRDVRQLQAERAAAARRAYGNSSLGSMHDSAYDDGESLGVAAPVAVHHYADNRPIHEPLNSSLNGSAFWMPQTQSGQHGTHESEEDQEYDLDVCRLNPRSNSEAISGPRVECTCNHCLDRFLDSTNNTNAMVEGEEPLPPYSRF